MFIGSLDKGLRLLKRLMGRCSKNRVCYCMAPPFLWVALFWLATELEGHQHTVGKLSSCSFIWLWLKILFPV